MWQKCPVCSGEGSKTIYGISSSSSVTATCNVCDGNGIISEATGLPPKRKVDKTSYNQAGIYEPFSDKEK